MVTNCGEKTKNHEGNAMMIVIKIAAIHVLYIRIQAQVGSGFLCIFDSVPSVPKTVLTHNRYSINIPWMTE